MLLFLQFSANSFYDPARRALLPTVVPRDKLPLATTLDSFAWSLCGAFGASLGGLAVRVCPVKNSAFMCLSCARARKLLACCAALYRCMACDALQG